jgi:Conjugative transposon, TraM
MKLQKNKIVFVMVMVCVVLFTVVYAMFTFGKDKEDVMEADRIPMPDLEGNPVEYESKLEAIEAIKEERETKAPPMYPEHMVDDKGYFNPDYMEYEKQRIIDSVYSHSYFVGKEADLLKTEREQGHLEMKVEGLDNEKIGVPEPISVQERSLVHQLFFASHPSRTEKIMVGADSLAILAYVDGDQLVREGHRLALRLAQDVQINGNTIPRGTCIYGFVKLRSNRVMVELSRLGNHGLVLNGYDLQDGREGLYVENHLQGKLVEKSVDETIGAVNLPGLPQLNGIKRIFQSDNRAIKVYIKDKYQIILKQ